MKQTNLNNFLYSNMKLSTATTLQVFFFFLTLAVISSMAKNLEIGMLSCSLIFQSKKKKTLKLLFLLGIQLFCNYVLEEAL